MTKDAASLATLEGEAVSEAPDARSEAEPAPPLVSIGMPVYNGQNYLQKAIASILGQTLTDFELIICDNASSDDTGEICRSFAARDRRVRYVRNARNIGAGPNFDLCFHLARGTYFRWAAHDDMMAPGSLERAIAALQQHPEAVMCTGGIVEIDAEDTVIRRYATGLRDMNSPDPVQRFATVIHTPHEAEDLFGIYRRSTLVGTGLIGTYSASDRVLLAEIALRGPWVQLNESLFLHREHAQRATRALLLVDRAAALRWQNPEAQSQRQGGHFHLVLYRHYWRILHRNLPPAQRRRGYRELARWWFTGGHFADVVRDVLQSIDPQLLTAARAVKRRLLKHRRGLRNGRTPSMES